MSPLFIVLLVLFTVTMFVWLLTLLGTVPTSYSPWLPWFACLVLGTVVFLVGTGVLK